MERLNAVLNWSFGAGNIKGIPVRVHIFLPIFILILCSGRQELWWWDVLYSIGVIGTVLVHELGHALTALRLRLNPTCIMLHPFGGWASYNGNATAKEDLIVSFMGPAMDFILAAILYQCAAWLGPSAVTNEVAFYAQQLCSALAYLNILLGALNLLPALPLDGGHITQAALAMRGTVRNTLRTTGIIGLVSSSILLLCGLYFRNDMFVWFAIIGLFGSFMAFQQTGGRTAAPVDNRKVREAQEKREREKAAQFLDEVRRRERDREERERLRKLFSESIDEDEA